MSIKIWQSITSYKKYNIDLKRLSDDVWLTKWNNWIIRSWKIRHEEIVN